MINIIGTGLAGSSAAVTLAGAGIKCRLISAQHSERAQSVLAEGGINAALDTMGEGDTRELHFEETMKGGCFLADPNAVRALTQGAPDIVRELRRIGVPFNLNEDGSMMLRSFGGQKKKRTAFAKSSTGKMIMTSLTDEVRKYEARGLVSRFPHHTFVRVLTDGDGKCAGVRVRDSYTGRLYDMPGKVIMCCGGLSGFFPGMTTGTVTNNGMAAALLFMQGVRTANLEMIQYHPTTMGIPGKRCLVSEAARGEGGRLFSEKDGKRCYFMEERYPVMKNLMPRDVVSREMYREMRDGRETFLDMTGLPESVWEGKLSDLREEIMHYFPVDPKRDPVPVQPGIHYFMGGIYVDARHETSMPGMYAAGEFACQYHGANRLGGNSMLGAVFGGMTAAKNISENAGSADGNTREITEFSGEEPFGCEASPSFMRGIGGILYGSLGIVRDEDTLRGAIDELDRLSGTNAAEDAAKQLARAMLMSAAERRESRGAHFRADFPETLEEYRKTTVSEYRNGAVRITFEDIPEAANEDNI